MKKFMMLIALCVFSVGAIGQSIPGPLFPPDPWEDLPPGGVPPPPPGPAPTVPCELVPQMCQ